VLVRSLLKYLRVSFAEDQLLERRRIASPATVELQGSTR
jgi:hypothetical protein